MTPRRSVAFLIVLAAVTQLVAFNPALPPDSQRFIDQAHHLLAGRGFVTAGVPETGLPPGYPVFLMLLLPFGGIAVIRAAQMVLFTAAAIILYAALRPAGERRALFVSAVFAANPWLASKSGAVLSEVFGIFLCATLVLFLSRIETGHARAPAFVAFGAATVAIVLTSPALVVVCFLLFLYVVVTRPSFAVATFAGALVLMIPWQIHCYAARGRILPLVYDGAPVDIEPWTRSWVMREGDLWFRWHPTEFAAAPPRAFESNEERGRLVAASRSLDEHSLVRLLVQTGQEAATRHPVRYYLVLPALRAVFLWTDMPQLRHAQIEYVGRFNIFDDARSVGWPRAFQRFGKAVISTAGLLLYVAVPLAFAIVAWRATRSGRIAPLCILVGIVAYTVISAWIAEGEARRNVVFYPTLLFTAFYLKNDEPKREGAS